MPRKVSLAPHFNAEELKEKYKKSHDNVEARRWHSDMESGKRLDAQE
ncbi:MAG: hypothetical protein QNJ72_31960 [Pleurocapsa sp. MO_226.B13]|nr:hypothetical protein [Pleurocapsa sp. MO_226.B13]